MFADVAGADIERLGQKGELVGVKKGYARNFLLPNQKAVLPSESNLKAYAEFTSVRPADATFR